MHSIDEPVSPGDIFEATVEEAEKTTDAGIASGEAQTPAGTPSDTVVVDNADDRERPDAQITSRATTAERERQSVARSAGVVALAVMGSRVLGLVREQVFAASFGAGFLKDAFDVAFRIPNLLRDLFAEGALSSAFVKTFTDYTENKTEEEAWALASMVMNALAVILSIITILGVLFSPQIVSIIADGFPPEKARLTVTLTRIMFPFILLVALAAVAMGVLNTKKQFGIPASASTLFNVGSILGGLAFAYWFSGGGWISPSDPTAMPEPAAEWAIMGMAVGTLIGGALQFLIQVPSLWRVGFRFRPLISFTDQGVRQVMGLMGPAVIGTAAVQINVFVSSYFASSINGGVASLGYAFRLMQLPIGIFGVAIGTAALPTIAKFATRRDIPNFRLTLSSSLSLVFLLTIPSACGLVVLGRPIVALIYQRGAFTATNTEMAAVALVCYAIGLAGYAAIKVLTPAFYALKDSRTPMIISLVSIAVNAAACYFLKDWFSTFGVTPLTPDGYGHAGLALSTSCVAIVNFLALVYFMRRKIKRLEGRRILSSFVRIVLASLVLSATSYVTYRWLLNLLGERTLSARFIETFVPILVGGAVFFAAARLLRVEELTQAQQAIMGRFAPRRR